MRITLEVRFQRLKTRNGVEPDYLRRTNHQQLPDHPLHCRSQSSPPIATIASKTITHFLAHNRHVRMHSLLTQRRSPFRTPKLSYLGHRNPIYHAHSLAQHHLPFSAVYLPYHLQNNSPVVRTTRSLAAVVKQVNRVSPYYTSRTFAFEVGARGRRV
jgi:hypothetical protein